MKKQVLLLLLAMSLFSAIQINAQIKVSSNVTLKSVDLRSNIEQYGLALRNQSPRGTCTIFATTFLIEYLTAKYQGTKNLDYSEEYLNAVTNRAIQKYVDGSWYAEAVIGYEEYGIVDEAQSPYQKLFLPSYLTHTDYTPDTLFLIGQGEAKRFLKGEVYFGPKAKLEPAITGITDEQFALIIKQLDSGIPVAVGYRGADNFQTIPVNDKYNAIDSVVRGALKNPFAHSVPLVGYTVNPNFTGGGYFIYRNSYGADWGDNGYGYMTFDYVKKYVWDILVFSKSTDKLYDFTKTRKDLLLKYSLNYKPSDPYLNNQGAKTQDSLMRRKP